MNVCPGTGTAPHGHWLPALQLFGHVMSGEVTRSQSPRVSLLHFMKGRTNTQGDKGTELHTSANTNTLKHRIQLLETFSQRKEE